MIEGLPTHSCVILNLINPKEKVWGVLLSLSNVGVTLRGINLDTFDDWIRQVARGGDEQTVDLVTMFVPLFRLERLFLDEQVGSVPSYTDYFEQVVGMPLRRYLALPEDIGAKR
jgi:hypothetical protein